MKTNFDREQVVQAEALRAERRNLQAGNRATDEAIANTERQLRNTIKAANQRIEIIEETLKALGVPEIVQPEEGWQMIVAEMGNAAEQLAKAKAEFVERMTTGTVADAIGWRAEGLIKAEVEAEFVATFFRVIENDKFCDDGYELSKLTGTDAALVKVLRAEKVLAGVRENWQEEVMRMARGGTFNSTSIFRNAVALTQLDGKASVLDGLSRYGGWAVRTAVAGAKVWQILNS